METPCPYGVIFTYIVQWRDMEMKRIFSILLITALLIGLVPMMGTVALAEEYATVTSENGYGVRLREGPSKAYGVIRLYSVGTTVNVLQTGAEWSQLRIGETVGWMQNKYLNFGTTGSGYVGSTIVGVGTATVTSGNGLRVWLRSAPGGSRIQLYSPGTPINYHVAQAEDNDYYLYRMIDGKYNRSGTLFMDYRNDPAMTDGNTLIYGHAMSIGTMFGTLERYKRQAYYEEHPVMYLLTPEADYALDLVAGYMTDVEDIVFTIPETAEDTDALLAHVLKKSAFKTKAELPEDVHLVTLSTCAYDFENARFVVVGILRELER